MRGPPRAGAGGDYLPGFVRASDLRAHLRDLDESIAEGERVLATARRERQHVLEILGESAT